MKKIITILLALVFTLSMVMGVFAGESEGESEGTTTTTVAETEFTINDLTYNSNSNVLEGKIAPGLEGYFDITIDATGCSVAVLYNVTIDFSKLTLSESIKFKKLVTVTDGVESDTGITRTAENTYTGTVSLSEVKNGTKKTLRVYINWENDTTGANDEADSKIGTNKAAEVLIPVEVQAKQYFGETITAYVETP